MFSPCGGRSDGFLVYALDLRNPQICTCVRADLRFSAYSSFIRPVLHSDNPAYVAHVCRENVRLAVETIRERSEILRTMEADGSLKIVGAYYDLRSGEVTPLP